jgi:hypothetical protein
MDVSISPITASVSILAPDVLGVRSDMNTISDRLMAQIQELMVMVQTLNKSTDSPPGKQQHPQFYRTPPTGLTLIDAPVTTSDAPPQIPTQRNHSHLSPTLPSRYTPPMKSLWANQHIEDDEMETAEYDTGNTDTTPAPRGNTNESTRGYGWGLEAPTQVEPLINH